MNVVDLLCERLGLKGSGKYVALGELFGVSRQVVNGWKVRNSIPVEHLRRGKLSIMTDSLPDEDLRLTLDELLPGPDWVFLVS